MLVDIERGRAKNSAKVLRVSVTMNACNFGMECFWVGSGPRESGKKGTFLHEFQGLSPHEFQQAHSKSKWLVVLSCDSPGSCEGSPCTTLAGGQQLQLCQQSSWTTIGQAPWLLSRNSDKLSAPFIEEPSFCPGVSRVCHT